MREQSRRAPNAEREANLNREVAAIDVVAEEEVARARRRAADLEQLEQVEELAVHIAAHCTHTVNMSTEQVSTERKA